MSLMLFIGMGISRQGGTGVAGDTVIPLPGSEFSVAFSTAFS